MDVRYNRGGDFSELLLQKLARRRLGYRVTRWYLDEASTGVMVALTNEQAGSDGDLFSYGFRPLIGTRTWGGVVGPWGRQRLVDGTLTTHPARALLERHSPAERGSPPRLAAPVLPPSERR